MTFRVAILTVSDRCSQGAAIDTAGPAVASCVCSALDAEVVFSACVADEVDEISDALRDWAQSESPPDLILTTGGTGLAPRDVTPEATLAVIERRHCGLVELMRASCGKHNQRAYLSRAEAGAIGRTLIINLPGSVRGAVESFEALAEILPHALGVLSGRDGDHARSAPVKDAAP